MKVTGRRVKRKRMSEINVVPYIDVMLVLLIIFMVTAPLLSEGIEVNLPESGAKTLEETEEEPLVVSVNREGDYFINLGEQADKPLQAETLVQRVNAILRQRNDKTVYVKGDRDANYGQVVTMMATLQEAGVRDLGLVTRSPDDAEN
ncbi:protein TolR [Thiohalophilus thiocyanatoxydans]|uniref:Tol-Pal system protein TolR n=1 Tax=Thiohalophilus thiocyanatoxydans TaxID=381308 RepID=A0A4R8IQX5_9GAMM|nr:protein TolR [Thiohalophilus thiocyanatoxydans]TDY01670.1 cell division and transport-associated protein TolR [Thiohalophilus thiocyanatoxydans]